jgi:hypothetical protein
MINRDRPEIPSCIRISTFLVVGGTLEEGVVISAYPLANAGQPVVPGGVQTKGWWNVGKSVGHVKRSE